MGLQFLPTPPDSSLLYSGIYSPAWVVVSVFLAILSCYAALRAATRMGQLSNTVSQLNWGLISGLTMGMGIWAMHFIGMLALSIPCRVNYDPMVTLASIIPGILAGSLAMGVGWLGRARSGPLVCSLLLAAGVATMHYTGMAAMRIEGFVRYDPTLFALSIVAVTVQSYAALRIKSSAMLLSGYKRDLLVAVILGCAVSSMHYTGMSSAYFVRGDASLLAATAFTPETLAVLIAVTTAFLALGALTLASISRNQEITDQLRESAEKIRLLLTEKETTLSNALVGIAYIRKRRIVSCNRRLEELFLYAPGELLGQPTDLLYDSPETYNHIGSHGYLIAAESNGFTGEVKLRHKDGSEFWGTVSGKAIDPTQPQEGSIWIYADITERKEAEQALRIASIAFESQNGTVITDANRVILRVNQAFTSGTGFGSDEVMGKTLQVLQSDHHTEDLHDAIWEEVYSTGAWTGELWQRRKNSEDYPAWVTITAVRSQSGIVTHYVVTSTDLTDAVRMKEFEQKSVESERRLSFALGAAKIGDWDMDLRSNVAVRSLEHDKCFGYEEPVAEWGYDTFLSHVDPSDRERVDRAYKKALAGEGEYDVEFRVIWPDQSEHWLWSKGRFYFDATGTPYRVAGIQIEITERRRMEQRLLELNDSLENRVRDRTQELELSNSKLLHTIQQLEQTQHSLVQAEKLAALGSMVAGVAHELNTPLGNALLILTAHDAQLVQINKDLDAGALSRRNFKEFFVRSQEMVQMATRALEASASLVESFKQVARDQLTEERRTFNLANVINEILASLGPRFTNEPWDFMVDVPADIVMDSFPGPLGQILLNLVLNSVGHGFEGRAHGLVTISARLDEGRSAVNISVADDGVGIAPEHIGRVFDPFFTTKLGKGGSGIGLNVSHRIATKILGGSIHVESVLGQGAQFKLTLPLRAPETL